MPSRVTLTLAFLLVSPFVWAQGIIDTVAGGGPNNVPALEANLWAPTGVATDTQGNFFIAALRQNRVFKVNASGTLTVVAGTGVPSFSGDGWPASDASLCSPTDVAVDMAGNLLIADSQNNRIRKVDPSGIITTVAGTGTLGFSGDGGPATDASLARPLGVAVDAVGNFFVAGEGNRVRKVDPSGIITTVAGTGTFGFSGDGGPATSASLRNPNGVAVDATGNLFIADAGNGRIRKIDPSGVITTVAGNGTCCFSGDGGPATAASLAPNDVAVDAAGNVFIAEAHNQRIRKVDLSGIITTVAGTGLQGFSGDGGPATDASLNSPVGVAVDVAGDLFVADSGNQRIRQVEPSGIIATVSGNGTCCFSGDDGPATGATLWNPVGVDVDAAGNVFIADESNQRVREVDLSGIITTVAGNGTRGFSGDGGPATNASLRFPFGVAVDAAGNLFIVDVANSRIRKVDPSGTITTVAGNGGFGFSGDGGPATDASLNGPEGVAVDATGNLFIADGNSRIRKVDPFGIITTVAGNGTRGFSGDGGPATDASLRYPCCVAVDATGNLFIADLGNFRIREVDPSGTITTVAGNGGFGFSGDGGLATDASFSYTVGVAVDAAGNLFIADERNQRVRKVDRSGIITTVAGNGFQRFSGDGGLATNASLSFPNGVAVDAAGNVFIADELNNRIRRVVFDPVTLINNLVAQVMGLNVQQGIENSLDSKLQAALGALSDINQHNDVAAINSLEAFINAVEAQRGKQLSDAEADALIAVAQAIIDRLNAP